MSSSRVHTTLTGPSTCLAMRGVRHIRLELSTEAPAEQMVVNGNLVFRQACGLGYGGVDPLHDLTTDPSLSRSRRDMHRAVNGSIQA
jgi:hypothetical protein